MLRGSDTTIWCSRCGVEITCDAWVDDWQLFCCRDCYLGYPCNCGERMEQMDERRISERSFADSYNN